MKLIHQILGLILGFIIGILTALSGLGLLGLWVYSDTKKNPPKPTRQKYHKSQPEKREFYREQENVMNPLGHIYPNQAAAEFVLDRLKSIIRDNEAPATVANLHVAIGHPATFKSSQFGWTNLDDVSVKKLSEDRYFIKFPDPVRIAK